MDFKDLVQTRRSIRKFTPQPLTDEELRLLLRAALMSPTGKGSRAWMFVVVQDRQTLSVLAHCKERTGLFIEECAAAIVVLGDPTVTDTWVEDTAIAAVTIQYQATELGLGSCWCQVRGREQAETVVRQALGLPEHLAVASIIAVGHPAQERPPQNEAALKWNQTNLPQ